VDRYYICNLLLVRIEMTVEFNQWLNISIERKNYNRETLEEVSSAQNRIVDFIKLDDIKRMVIGRRGSVNLTETQYVIFSYLMEDKNNFIPYEMGLRFVGRRKPSSKNKLNTLKVIICHLRKNVSKIDSRINIKNIRNHGYQMVFRVMD
jgi:DNA-binding response OmpR family regulator